MKKQITISDLMPGAKFKTPSGTIWIIDSVSEEGLVRTSMEHGSKGNYRDPIHDVVEFLNGEKAELINA